MGLIVDTSILVAAERNRFDLDGLLVGVPEARAGTSVICISELLHGLERARLPTQQARRKKFADLVLRRFVVHPFELEDARVHARIGARLAETGLSIGELDLQIAATCIRLGYELATLNVAEFARVPGLALAETARFAR